MTRAEAFEKAWRLAFKEDDFSLFDEIYHPDFKGFPPVAEVEVDLCGLKEVARTMKDFVILSPVETAVGDDTFLKLNRFNKLKEADIFNLVTVTLNYKDGKIIYQEIDFEELNYDPSEGQDWNWEDYE